MNNEPFDKELSALYQQRKSHIVAPNITLAESSNNKKYSLIKLLSIFTLGGVASFGIMAIMTHFAKSPEPQQPMLTSSHQVKIAEAPPKPVDDEVIVIKPELPPKPGTPTIESEIAKLAPAINSAQASNVENIDLNAIQIVKLPHLKEPEFIIKPIYKVMPKFSNNALRAQQSGSIRLRYEIDRLGDVRNIEIINSNVSRALQRSAKKALAQWKYTPGENIKKNYEIIFEFTAEKS
ncbi:hypothetical protein tinsulaeT_16110 [Thalassotalea insulae]|uniref:Protein TonB n=1 Tax=Thalassotalea insulae TaxID=2056778 RepID=A0ABQ6GUA7_9GAMM|nr:TonB family protein [Thalassotalea insulae]GLX78271.1 hypothetical protein tinsulaeT_16110 [Thalassotalea insulae]